MSQPQDPSRQPRHPGPPPPPGYRPQGPPPPGYRPYAGESPPGPPPSPGYRSYAGGAQPGPPPPPSYRPQAGSPQPTRPPQPPRERIQQPPRERIQQPPRERIPHPRPREEDLYAPGVPRINGRYDLRALDRKRAEADDTAPETPARFFTRIGTWAAGSCATMAMLTLIVWLTSTGNLRDNQYDPIPAEDAGTMGWIGLLVVSWAMPVVTARYQVGAMFASRRWVIPTYILSSGINAGILSLGTAVWTLFIPFAPTGLLIDDWTPSVLGLSTVFLVCWAASLASLFAVMFCTRMMGIQPWVALLVGIPVLLVTMFGVMLSLMLFDELRAGDYGQMLTVAGIAIPVLIAANTLFAWFTGWVFDRRVQAAERRAESGAPGPFSPSATRRR